MTDPTDNPLLDCERIPPFDRIVPAHVEPAIRSILPTLTTGLNGIETSAVPGWDLVVRLGNIIAPLDHAWSAVNHLTAVCNSPELRAAHHAMQNEVVAAYMRVGQSVPIYNALKTLRDSAEWSKLDACQQRIVEASLRQAELAGVSLTGASRDRFNAIQLELAEASTHFGNNLLDATKAYALVLRDPAEIDGLPPSVLAVAYEAARAAGDVPEGTADEPSRGPWRISLDFSSFGPFMEHSRRRDLREQVYRAYVTRASSGPPDNQGVIDQILRLRREQAKLLGYESFAALSVSRKMATRVETVENLLNEIRAIAMPAAQVELEELRAFAKQFSGSPEFDLQPWDVSFYVERLREQRFDVSDETLRPYFSLPRVLDGLFALAQRLFGVVVRAADGEAPVWHPDVRFFKVEDQNGSVRAAFFLDPYTRPATKRGGAWMNNALDRKRRPDGSVRLPVAYLVCNQSPPAGGLPSLMTFREVETLFHEFGHGLQHMLTEVDHPEAAGINNVEWDAVELPSQFMENWCYHKPTLLHLARHVETGQPLPEDVFERLRAARVFRAGSRYLRQNYLATLDLELHHRYAAADGQSVLDVQRAIATRNTVMPPLPEDRFLCGFSHVFAGGYAAGYYSYVWAEVLSADAFGAFEEAGLDDANAIEATGLRFRSTVLARGGSQHPMEVFRAFRGREPTTATLMRHAGLALATTHS